jgi:hypothetical protein
MTKSKSEKGLFDTILIRYNKSPALVYKGLLARELSELIVHRTHPAGRGRPLSELMTQEEISDCEKRALQKCEHQIAPDEAKRIRDDLLRSGFDGGIVPPTKSGGEWNPKGEEKQPWQKDRSEAPVNPKNPKRRSRSPLRWLRNSLRQRPGDENE